MVSSSLLQPVFRLAHRCALAGMNIGIGSDVESSGERYAQKYVSNLLLDRDALVIFDVGANVGAWTRSAIDIFPSNAEFHCFEPSGATCQLLSANLAGIGSRLMIHNIGVGEVQGELTLYRPEQSSIASLYRRPGYQSMGGGPLVAEKVIIRRIDSVCREAQILHIDYLKLDIEGHEISALKGCGEMLSEGAISVIQFEFGGCNIDSRTYFRDFWDLLSPNYRIYRLLARQLYEVVEYQEWMEQFSTTNYLAVFRK